MALVSLSFGVALSDTVHVSGDLTVHGELEPAVQILEVGGTGAPQVQPSKLSS